MEIVQLVVAGLAVGSVYALAGLSVALVFRTARLFHLVVGEGVALGGLMLAVGLQRGWGWGLLLSTLSGLCFGALLGILAEKLRNREVAEMVVALLGLSLAVKNLFLVSFGPTSRPVPSMWPGVLRLGEVVVNRSYLLTLLLASVLVAGLLLFFDKTRLGRRVEALAEDQEAARVLGIPAARLQFCSFLAAGLVGSLAGLLLAPVYYPSPTLGNLLLLKAVTAAIVGGLLNPAGAVTGGFLLALGESLGAFYLSAYRDALTYAFMLWLLVFFPGGLFRDPAATRV